MNTRKMRKVAWGITGSGDKLRETVEAMKKIKKQYENDVKVHVYVSKAGAQVLKYYRLEDEFRSSFEKITTEIDANSPFLAGSLQIGNYEFLLIAPATSNTVAKIAFGIADSLLSNSVIMALKASVPVYVMPSDWREGEAYTILPTGQKLKIKIRREDAENVERLREMENVSALENPRDINQIFEKHFRQDKA